MLSLKTDVPVNKIFDLFCNESGYQTPKVDTRAAVFVDGKILLVHENNGTWSLPGGWCDVDQSVASNTEKEVQEEAGLTVKINTVVIPGFNTGEIEEIACWAARAGAAVMNLMPLIPQAGFRDNEPPSRALLEALRARARVHIPQFTHCRQCRADAVGVPGE